MFFENFGKIVLLLVFAVLFFSCFVFAANPGHSILSIDPLAGCSDKYLKINAASNGWECAVPSGAGSGVTSVSTAVSGSGIVLTPNPIVATGSVKLVDCPAGQILKSSAPGTWACAADATGSGGGSVSISQGTGLSFSVNPITTTGTIGLNTVGLASGCGNATTGKVYWDSANNRLACGTDRGTGTVTSVATGAGLTGGPITITGTISVNAPSCSGATQKLLWNGSAFTCGTDQAGSGLGGSGTANYVSKFTAGTTLGNSQIFDNGTNVGIGTTSPAAKLHISGSSDQLLALEGTGANSYLRFRTAGADRGYIGRYNNNLDVWSQSGNLNLGATDGTVVISGGGLNGEVRVNPSNNRQLFVAGSGGIYANKVQIAAGGAVLEGNYFRLPALGSPPFACDRTAVGGSVYFDISSSSGWLVPCVCVYSPSGGWRWRPFDNFGETCD